MITPTEIMLAITEVPPPERRGRVIPVTGIMPIVMAIFSKAWNRNIAVKPMTIRAPYRSTESLIMVVNLPISRPYIMMTAAPPMKPSSSTTTKKIKSDCCTGMKSRKYKVKWNSTYKKKPPEPIATLDCHT